ncbi:VOC family protein [Ancylobacter defluvii]|uniref:3-demethylubiquinone-9 3-methyltransferase n=1 Tax=Ancylobacter defluvii TaxID=1282440 RepID=A0A9W6JVE4_9HYPH|nr:VOC family protein [Ancylobacter defluvii]MBS7588994.1 VOC family protein [Ancylobacter defluvii]GLK84600.1 putative 3-demethylubiquinone-9 3-methyltransferase [Ancylobacter defluvii]
MGLKQAITPYLWFDTQAEEAARFYVSVFPNSRILTVARYSELGPGPEGSVMVVLFELDGMQFGAINGGTVFKLSEATSFLIDCKTQEEIDFYWEKLGAGGLYQPCGWVKDRFGLSWQVNSSALVEKAHADPATSRRVMEAMMQMTKIDLAVLQKAAEGA